MREAASRRRGPAGWPRAHHVATFEDTVALLLKRLRPGDPVLVKGSRGMRMERVVAALLGRASEELDWLVLYDLLVPLASTTSRSTSSATSPSGPRWPR